MNEKATKALAWMREHAAEHLDMRTGEVNTTSLAEECCNELQYGLGPDQALVPHAMFEISYAVGSETEGGMRSVETVQYVKNYGSNAESWAHGLA